MLTFNKSKTEIIKTVKTTSQSDSNTLLNTGNTISESIAADTKKHSNLKDNEQSVDDLKLNLSSLAVLGICDTSPAHFSINEMTANSSSFSSISKSSEALNDLRNKRSLKLLEDCVEKLVKFEANKSPPGGNAAAAAANEINRKAILTKFENSSLAASKQPNWLIELQNYMSKYIQNNIPGATSHKTIDISVSQSSNSIKLAITSKMGNANQNYQPLKNAIKLVSNATIVLTCRELLILFINWSLKRQERSVRNELKPDKKLSIMQINCETEFELLQLLDILYYTDNSINYRLFIKNLIVSLNLAETTKKQSGSSSLTSSQAKILSKISMMACDFMLPEYKLLKKINWSSEDDPDIDSGKLRNKLVNESLYEENINFSASNYSNKQTLDIESGLNLTCKPNDIEKLSTSFDSTLLIVFDTKKSIQNSNNLNNYMLNSSSIKSSMSNARLKQLRQKNFLKYSTNLDKSASNRPPNKTYFTKDEYENVKPSALIEETGISIRK